MRHLLLILLAIVVTAIGACGGKSKEEVANEAVAKGLQAHFEGRLDEASSSYHQALDENPRDKYALFNLGVIEQSSGRGVSAENFYRLALATDPDFPPALFNLAILRNDAGAVQEAIQLYRRAITVEPGNASAHLNLGFALATVGQQGEADASLQRAVQLNPALASRVPPPAQPPTAARPEGENSPTVPGS